MQLSSDQLTLLLNRVVDNPEERDRPIFKQIYQELHRIAARYMARESPRHSLQITGLVHEAYLELVADENRNWQNRAHFFGYAARVMRHILVRHAKQKKAEKRGGGCIRTTLEELEAQSGDVIDLLALDQALSQLEEWDAGKARTLELRFLAGLSIEEVALVTSRSVPSVYKDLKIAKGWLYHALARS